VPQSASGNCTELWSAFGWRAYSCSDPTVALQKFPRVTEYRIYRDVVAGKWIVTVR